MVLVLTDTEFLFSFRDFLLSFIVLIEKVYQTIKTMIHHISKHLAVRHKLSAAHRILNDF